MLSGEPAWMCVHLCYSGFGDITLRIWGTRIKGQNESVFDMVCMKAVIRIIVWTSSIDLLKTNESERNVL